MCTRLERRSVLDGFSLLIPAVGGFCVTVLRCVPESDDGQDRNDGGELFALRERRAVVFSNDVWEPRFMMCIETYVEAQ